MIREAVITRMKLKFNLHFGGEQVRTIEDVRTQATNAREILSEIMKTFQEKEETDTAYVEVDFSVFDYFDGSNKFRADFRSGQLYEKLDTVLEQGSAKVIQEYHRGYDALVQDILDHHDDLTYIYDRLDDLAAGYSTLIKASSTNLLERFRYKAPLAALALFGHSGTRSFLEYGLFGNMIMKLESNFLDNREEINEDLLKKLSPIVQKFEDDKEHSRWHSIQANNKKFLVLCSFCSDFSSKFRLASSDGHDASIEVKYGDIIINKIFNGIDIMCEKYSRVQFYYMEAR